MQIKKAYFKILQGSVKLAFTVISIILRRTVKTSWMEVTAMKEKVQMNKTGKPASFFFKTVQAALEQIIAKAVLRILLHKV